MVPVPATRAPGVVVVLWEERGGRVREGVSASEIWNSGRREGGGREEEGEEGERTNVELVLVVVLQKIRESVHN